MYVIYCKSYDEDIYLGPRTKKKWWLDSIFLLSKIMNCGFDFVFVSIKCPIIISFTSLEPRSWEFTPPPLGIFWPCRPEKLNVSSQGFKPKWFFFFRWMVLFSYFWFRFLKTGWLRPRFYGLLKFNVTITLSIRVNYFENHVEKAWSRFWTNQN